MKALTLTQPWALLVAIGAKRFETRSWNTAYRGPLAIHAAKSLDPVGGEGGLRELCWSEPFASVLAPYDYEFLLRKTRGTIVAVGSLYDTFTSDDAAWLLRESYSYRAQAGEHELAFGNYEPGRFAFQLTRLVPLDEPISCRGQLGLWDVPADIAADLQAVRR